MSFSVVIVAAGGGTRAGPGLAKQWRGLSGKPVLRWSVAALLAAGARDIVVVVSEDGETLAAEALAGLTGWRTARGAATRAGSVRNGLAALEGPPDEPVLVHDAARPFVTAAHVTALLRALDGADGAIPALPVADTLKRADADARIDATVPRGGLWAAQTPQMFRFGVLLEALEHADLDHVTDEAGAVEARGLAPRLIEGDPANLKVTYPRDLRLAAHLLTAMGDLS